MLGIQIPGEAGHVALAPGTSHDHDQQPAEVALQFPGRVERLVLVSAAGISIVDLRREPVLAAARVVAGVTARTAARRRDFMERPRARHLVLSAVMRHPSRIKADIAYEMTHGAGKPGFIPALEALTSYDFRDRLSDIECPTLLVWGDKDALVPVRDADEFERLIPSTRKVVLEDTGHVSMLERPKPFNDLLEEFLAERREALLTEAEVEERAYAPGGTEGTRTPAGA
jgi:pimeloyl-ACP methyl ester carboxylesterase